MLVDLCIVLLLHLRRRKDPLRRRGAKREIKCIDGGIVGVVVVDFRCASCGQELGERLGGKANP